MRGGREAAKDVRRRRKFLPPLSYLLLQHQPSPTFHDILLRELRGMSCVMCRLPPSSHPSSRPPLLSLKETKGILRTGKGGGGVGEGEGGGECLESLSAVDRGKMTEVPLRLASSLDRRRWEFPQRNKASGGEDIVKFLDMQNGAFLLWETARRRHPFILVLGTRGRLSPSPFDPLLSTSVELHAAAATRG